MLTRILTHHQVMPEYLDFIFVFGTQSDPKDLRFSGFRQQTMLEEIPSIPAIPGRSWRQYQLCYNLKGVSLVHLDRGNPTANEWSVRQVAIYHQFDVVHGTTLWIVTKGNLDLQQRFKQLTSENAPRESNSFGNAQECFRSSLAAHLMYCRWSTEDWRWYIGWLEGVIDKEVGVIKHKSTRTVLIRSCRLRWQSMVQNLRAQRTKSILPKIFRTCSIGETRRMRRP